VTNVGLTPGTFDPSLIGPVELSFSEAEYRSRIAKVREMMSERGIDLLWVTTPEAVCWLHGYFTSWYKANSPMRYPQCYGTAIHVGSERIIHFDNPTEMPVMARTSVCKDSRWLPDRRATPNLRFITEQLAKEGWLQGTVGLEFWSYIPNRAISTMFEGAFRAAGCEVVDASSLLRRARRVKSAQEIAYIEKAVEICDIGHRTIREQLRPGITELDLFGAVTHAMMKAGGEFPALIPIFNACPVVDGVPQSIGHSMASAKIINAGELLVADLCGVYHRYHGNAMRGYFLGDPPKKMVERYRLAAGVYDVIKAELKAGMTVREVNRRLMRYYDVVGLWSETGGWALGYELGLSLPPDWVGDFYFNLGDDEFLDRVFEDGMVTNFESLFDTALIDTLVWRKDGCHLLSKMPLELIAVG
jgi:Xaa-Pro aminopeptidase